MQDKSIKTKQIQFNSAVTRIEPYHFTGSIWLTLKHYEYLDFRQIDPLSPENAKNHRLDFEPGKYILNQAHNNFLVVSNISDPGKPHEFETIIYDSTSRKIVNKQNGGRFSGFVKPSRIEMEAGGFESINKEYIDLSALRKESPDRQFELQLPNLFFKSSEHYSSMRDFLEQTLDNEVYGPIEVLEYNQFVIMSVHIRRGDDLEKYLLILDEKGSIEFTIRMYQKLKKAIPDSFFVFRDFLIFVTEFSTLNLSSLNIQNAT